MRVRSRTPPATRPRISANSRSRPRSGHAATGRFVLPSDLSGGKSRLPELVDAFGGQEVLEPVLTEVAKVTVDERCRRLRHEHLSSMAGRRDTRSAMDVDAHVALVGAGEASPCADRPAREPGRA